MQGYIKLYRKIMDSPVWSDSNYLKLWMYCLMRATHKEREVIAGNQVITLEPGQFITGRDSLSEDLNRGAKPKQRLSDSTWWRYLNNLEKWQMLNINKTNKFSVISIINWNQYQETEQQLNIKRTSDEQRMNTNKNVKNDKNEKNNKKTSRPKLKFETHHLKLAELLFKKIKENNPVAKEPNLETWANTFRLMMDRDERAGKEIQDLILWSQGHHFWYKNILSADKLRKQYDRLLLEMNDDHRKPLKVIAGGKAEAADDGYNYGF